ncbi:hypothetical protein HA49_19590 [Tatumella morbirosei]|uniref:Uncharacterized protein n=1 Tax=Tatumella morbirosei TaxID=642227 RepID=A0A095T239_9GAMM|nr:hypothetical protein HA49_19590 [Tatumella morbirosei]
MFISGNYSALKIAISQQCCKRLPREFRRVAVKKAVFCVTNVKKLENDNCYHMIVKIIIIFGA